MDIEHLLLYTFVYNYNSKFTLVNQKSVIHMTKIVTNESDAKFMKKKMYKLY